MHAVKEGLVHYMYKGADRVGFICWVFGGAALHFIVLFSTLKEQRKKMDGWTIRHACVVVSGRAVKRMKTTSTTLRRYGHRRLVPAAEFSELTCNLC